MKFWKLIVSFFFKPIGVPEPMSEAISDGFKDVFKEMGYDIDTEGEI